MADVPDYSDEQPVAPTEDVMKRLTGLVVKQAQLELEIEDLEAQLQAKKAEHVEYSAKMIPELMESIGLDTVKTRAGGIQVEIKTDVHASFPQDETKRAIAMRYLRDTGNDGILKRQFVIRYGRDSAEWARSFAKALESMDVSSHATVEDEITIHNQTLCKFIRDETEEGRPIPVEAFGGFIRKVARIKRGKR